MSHALAAPSGRTYFHDEDFSGGFDVHLDTETPGGTEKIRVSIPKEDVIAMAAAMVRSEIIDFAEGAPDVALVALLGAALPRD